MKPQRDPAFDMNREFDEAVQRTRDTDAEAAVIGGCMLKPSILEWLDLEPEAFFDARHQAVWRAIQALRRDRMGVDEVTVASALRASGKLDFVGGPAFIAQLGLRVPTEDNTVYYADVVRENHCTREILYRCATAASRSRSMRGEELLADMQRALAETEPHRRDQPLTAGAAAEEELRALLAFLDRQKTETVSVGIRTGVELLDQETGGIPTGVVSVLAARTGVGKSTLVRNMAQAASAQGGGAHVLTWEDRRSTFAQRDLADESGVDVKRIRSRDLEGYEVSQLIAAADRLRERKRIVWDHAHGMSAARAIRRVRAMRRELGTRLVVVDYIQLLPAPGRGMKKHEQVEANLNAFAELAGQEDLAVVVVAQLGREVEKENRRPRLSDMKDSGAIEQVGKLIIALHPTSNANEIEVLVLKNHQGPKDLLLVARYDAARSRIR